MQAKRPVIKVKMFHNLMHIEEKTRDDLAKEAAATKQTDTFP